MTLKDKPAYPCKLSVYGELNVPKEINHPGMTLFESFVKAAMQGLCANTSFKTMVGGFDSGQIARLSIKHALAQIEAIEKLYEAEKEKGNGH